jgi:type VI secretion system protein ImpL
MILYLVAAIFVLAVWVITLATGLSIWIAVGATLFVALGLGARFAWIKLRAERAAREIERSLARQAGEFEKRARPDQEGDVRALQSEFQKALDTLKSSKLARGGQGNPLYALPWYVIIGPPGAGKSTAIRQSGLKFPLLGAQGQVRGIGGTRNCDWWLSNEAVLLDTAGRYATEQDDQVEWQEFLGMLRRARPRLPLNGLIVAVSVLDLVTGTEASVEELAHKIRARIDEVISRLGTVLPVYVLLTKCDLLPGFIESFEELRKTERSQVFGFTFSVSDTRDVGERTAEQWTRLVQVVERRAITRMADARSREQRQRIYEFAQHMEALETRLVSFMSAVFVSNVYQDAPLLRGVYLTSGTQEGSPVDRLMGSMAAAFGLPPPVQHDAPRTDAKSYFLGELFSNVLFPDHELAIRSTRAQKQLQLLRVAAAGLLALAALVLISFPLRSFSQNRAIVEGAQGDLSKVAAYYEAKHAEAVTLETLEPLRARLEGLRKNEREGVPLSMGFGLYQGNEVLPSVQRFYLATLRKALVEPIVRTIERDMWTAIQANEGLGQAPTVSDHARLYEWTRAYLLLTTPREAAEPALDEGRRKWLTSRLVDAWSQQMKRAPSPTEREAMPAHVDTYLALLAADPKLALTRDAEVVRRARELLSRVSQTKLAVDRIAAEIEPLGWHLGFEQLVGASGLPVSATGRVAGAFTRRAWEEGVRELLSKLPEELMGDGWVLAASGMNADADKTTEARLCALRSEYFGRYVDEWKAFIGTIRVEEPANHPRAVVVLQDLTRGQPPPLERVMRSVAYNAQLGDPAKATGEGEKLAEATGLLDRLRQKVDAVAPAAASILAKKDPCANGDYVTERDVGKALEGFFSFGASLDQPKDAAAPAQLTSIQIYQEQLSFVRDALQAYLDSPTAAEPLLARLSAARTRVRSLIETQEVGWRPRFDALLWPPINGASASSTSALAGEKGSQWCTSVVLPFDRTLKDRYPFSKQGQDVALADVAEFYRPGSGIVWAFYDSALKRDVPQVGESFQPQPGVGESYNGELVRFLNRSFRLSNALFPPRGERPRVDFEVRVRPSPGIASTILTIDGQVVDFHNGPEKWVRITWPGEGGKIGATMRVRGAAIDETLKQEGEWGLFRLFEKGTISANPGERFFTVRWRLHTQNDVTIDIRPARTDNPFVGAKAYLEAFRGDGVLAPRTIATGAPACPE